jgi:hypothetical protein
MLNHIVRLASLCHMTPPTGTPYTPPTVQPLRPGNSPPHHHPALPPPASQHELPSPDDRPPHPAHPVESSIPPAISISRVQHTPLPAPRGRPSRLAPDAREHHLRPRDYPTFSVDPQILPPHTHAPSASNSNGLEHVARSPRVMGDAHPTTLPHVARPSLSATSKPANYNRNGTARPPSPPFSASRCW